MELDYETVKRNSDKALEIIVPRLAEEYDLSLNKPNVSVTNIDYMPDCVGRFSPIGRYGLIKLQKESCMLKEDCCKTVSHEMGHAAIYQNCPTYEKYYNNKKDSAISLFLVLEEGISKNFENKGLKILKEEKYVSGIYFYSDILGSLIFGRTLGALFLNKYRIGEMIIDYYNRKGVGIKKLITSTEEFKEDLEKNWKEMLSPFSKKVIDFYEKVFFKE